MGAGYHGGFGKTNGAKQQKEKETGTQLKMPNHTQAITPKEKFLKYSLDYSNKNAAGKAEAYENGLGYNQSNYHSLVTQIHNAVTSGTSTPYEVTESEYGTKFKYRIPVTGPNGKTKNVIAVYQVDKGSETPRLITNYLEGK
ncbi:MAG: hypothetical protein LUH82_01735 [Clostridiales bacterium]|nr:hypothetical protein [Clostridiales bacterium]